ncbi:MAG TPA: holo-ACP synthase [Solirubrobacteraceae bacterium]|jgi:holo-[acyl-carrier protein] synthase|nr:holo-ACP synthase [Solirubrobacteraceae bacterium]
MAHAGIDLLEIDRLERALARQPNLGERLFTDAERAYAESRARPAQHLAARWCAKEAVTKALGLTVLRPHEIEVLAASDRAADPRPRVALHGAALRRASELGVEVSVSLTHSRDLAGAVAVAA